MTSNTVVSCPTSRKHCETTSWVLSSWCPLGMLVFGDLVPCVGCWCWVSWCYRWADLAPDGGRVAWPQFISESPWNRGLPLFCWAEGAELILSAQVSVCKNWILGRIWRRENPDMIVKSSSESCGEGWGLLIKKGGQCFTAELAGELQTCVCASVAPVDLKGRSKERTLVLLWRQSAGSGCHFCPPDWSVLFL